MLAYISEIIACLSGLLGGSGIGIFYARKKQKAEVESDQIDNLKKSLDFYITTVEDNNIRLNDLRDQNHNLEAQVASLKEDNVQLKDLVVAQNRTIQELTERISVLTETINSLTGKEE